MKRQWLLLIFASLIILTSAYVAAQPDNMLEPLLSTIDSLKIGENYENYASAVNFFVYLVIFCVLTHNHSSHLVINSNNRLNQFD